MSLVAGGMLRCGVVVMRAAVVVVRDALILLQRVVCSGLDAQLALHAGARGRAQHGGRYRAPQGEQHGKHNQEAEAKSSHVKKVSTRLVGARHGTRLDPRPHMLHLATVARSSGKVPNAIDRCGR